MTRVLVAGIPRSGTTWVGRGLGLAEGSAYLHEPDNDLGHPFAMRAKRALGRFPLLAPDEAAPGYERLWREAFEGGRGGVRVRRLRNRAARAIGRTVPRTELQAALASPGSRRPARVTAMSLLAVPASAGGGRDVVAKSVHAPLALEWIDRRWRPAMVIVLRSPLNVLASLLELGLPDRDRRLDEREDVREQLVRPLGLRLPPPGASDVARAAWQVALLTVAVEDAASRNPDWIVAAHEDLCVDPRASFRELCDRTGLRWSEAVEAYVDESNRPGTGFSTNRVSSAQPERWRQRLTVDQVDEIRAVLKGFPLARWNTGEERILGGSA